MGKGKYRCKKGSAGNPDGSRPIWNPYKQKCKRRGRGGRRKPCRAGASRNRATGRCKMGYRKLKMIGS